MLFNPVALVFAPASDEIASVQGLCASGFDLRHFRSQESLYAEVHGLADTHGVAALLMGTTAENRDAIYYLRTIRAGLGLVAQLRTGSEEEQMALIQAGADWISPVGASSDLLATLLLSLWNRRMPRSSPSVGARYSAQWRHGEWSLEDQAWTLMCPARIRVGLTSSERGLLMALFESPNLSAPYDALSAAINMAQNVPPAHNARTRLGVLVSRLRSKCRRHGVDLPIRVLPNFGYMFVALEQSMSAR